MAGRTCRAVVVLVVALLLRSSLYGSPKIYFVNVGSGNDANAGTSGSPFKTITHALGLAVSGDQVLVSAGTYSAATGETFPLVLPSGVSLTGITPAMTIIDATNPSHDTRAIEISGSSASTRLSGFTIENAYFKETSIGSNANGGAILLSGDATITQNVITNNTVEGYPGVPPGASGGQAYGGAIYISSGIPHITNNIFSFNVARGGPGATTTDAGLNPGNGGGGTGGAVNNFGGAFIVNNTFVGNSAAGGAGGTSAFVDHATFGGNANSGAVSANAASIINNIFVNNSSVGGAKGNGSGSGNGTAANGAFTGNSVIDDNLLFANSPNDSVSADPVLADPLFVNSASHDYHLQSSSPAKGAGSHAAAPETDFDGTPRPDPPSIGAYEAPSVPAIDHFVVSAPATVAKNASFNVTVTARDASNTTLTAYAGTVHFASSDASATLPVDYTFVSGDNGVHTFSVTMQTYGAQSLTVNDTATIAASGTTSVDVLGPFGAPPTLTATATGPTQVQLVWTAVSGATGYTVYRRGAGEAFGPIASPSSASYTDNNVTAGNAYIYEVQTNGTTTYSPLDIATTVFFDDDPLPAGAAIKAVHITQLRSAVAAVRLLANLSTAAFTDASLTGIRIKAVHVTQLRAALDEARATLTLPAITYTDPTITAGSTVIKHLHIVDLRNGVK
jgi:hypothetical protein